jgi:hypothetical protein
MLGTKKAWAQAVATVLAGLIPFLVDDQLSGVELINTLLLLLSAVAVYIVPNLADTIAKYAKGTVAIGTAVGTLLVSLFADGSYALDTSEWIQLGLAALGAVGVVGFKAPQYLPTPRPPLVATEG